MGMLKTIHFWKLHAISNQKNNVAICADNKMAAIWDFKKWLPEKAYPAIFLPLNKIELRNRYLNTHFNGREMLCNENKVTISYPNDHFKYKINFRSCSTLGKKWQRYLDRLYCIWTLRMLCLTHFNQISPVCRQELFLSNVYFIFSEYCIGWEM